MNALKQIDWHGVSYRLGRLAIYAVGLLMIAILIDGLVSMARADDAKAPQWTGFYVGASVQGGAATADPILGTDLYGAVARIGWDAKLGRLVAGVFADAAVNRASVGGTNVNEHEFSLGGRGGVLVNDNALLYALVAETWAKGDFGIDTKGISFGGGLETKLTPEISAVLEYRRTNFDSICGLNPVEQVARVGLNYHFDWK
jgi:opacity protein-like surface antigen